MARQHKSNDWTYSSSCAAKGALKDLEQIGTELQFQLVQLLTVDSLLLNWVLAKQDFQIEGLVCMGTDLFNTNLIS